MLMSKELDLTALRPELADADEGYNRQAVSQPYRVAGVCKEQQTPPEVAKGTAICSVLILLPTT